MKLTKRALSIVLALALVVSMFSVAVISVSAAPWNNYSTAAAALDAEYAYSGELGALYTPESTTFRVWAPLATEVKLNRYATGSDSETGANNLGTVPMEKLMDGAKWTGVWTVNVSGDIVNTYYTYSITNPDHIYGATTTVTHETQDIYSKAVGVNGDRSMVVDLRSSATNPDGWDNDKHVYVDHQTDAIVWEVQVKDFSYNENSGVSEANRGKFLAFTETGTTLNGEGNIATGIDYLKELGITHVQINPFYDFATINEAGSSDQFNWGYDPKNYGVPEGSYSSNPYDGNVRIKEAKAMIKALHDAGIGVIMDVVYNHTYSREGSFTYSVPEYYYRMTADGAYSDQSGCGNDTASERAMYRKYMRDMLKYWTEEYHIDGYRFDLMGVHDGETMNLIREDMDAIDSRIIMFGEGWAGGTVYDPTTCSGTDTFMTDQTNAKKLSTRIGFFNDQIRDGIKGGVFDGAGAKGFVNGNKTCYKDISYGVRANTFGSARWKAVSPEQCVTYASCHDNNTLYDKLVMATYGTSADYRKRYADLITQNKLTAAIISSSQGIDFILAGEEMGRSKDGDENSYRSAATLNMIDWSQLVTNADLVSYYKGMFELRKAFSPFTAFVSDENDDSYEYYFATGVSATNNMMAYIVTNSTEGEWNKVAVLFNGGNEAAKYKFDTTLTDKVSEDTEWVIVVNDKAAGVTKLDEVKGLEFSLPANSAIVAVEKSTFEQANISSNFTKVVINNIYDKDNSMISSNMLLGNPGSGYVTVPDDSVPLQYELKAMPENATGTFGDEDVVIDYHYTDYIPNVFTVQGGDVDGDNNVSILDGTAIQQHLAKILTLTDAQKRRADYDYSTFIDIIDVTTLQRYLAHLNGPVCEVTTKFIGDKAGKEISIAQPVTKQVRYGYKYETAPASVAYYVLDGEPANASGTCTGDVTVTYHYTYSVSSPIIHVKHAGAQTWAPTLWAWAYDNGNPVNAYAGWPGYTMQDKDEEGWYTTTFPVPGGLDYYFILSKEGSPQTQDFGPIKYDDYPEIWVVIDDHAETSELTDKGAWLKYYNYNPEKEN